MLHILGCSWISGETKFSSSFPAGACCRRGGKFLFCSRGGKFLLGRWPWYVAQKMMVEGTAILRRSSINACLVCYWRFSTWIGWHVMEVRGRGMHVCWLYYSLWLIIVTNYKVTYTPIICIQYIVTHVLEQLSVPSSRVKQFEKCQYPSIYSA